LGSCIVDAVQIMQLTTEAVELSLKLIRESDEAPTDAARKGASIDPAAVPKARGEGSAGARPAKVRSKQAAAGAAATSPSARPTQHQRRSVGPKPVGRRDRTSTDSKDGGEGPTSPRVSPRGSGGDKRVSNGRTPRPSGRPSGRGTNVDDPRRRAAGSRPVGSLGNDPKRQSQPPASGLDYGTIYFSMARTMEHQQRETTDGVAPTAGARSDDDTETTAVELSQYEAIDLTLTEMLLPEGQKIAVKHWDALDPDGLGLVSLHHVCGFIKAHFPVIHNDAVIEEAYQAILDASGDIRPRDRTTVTRRTWVEPQWFIRLFCVTFHFQWMLDHYTSRIQSKEAAPNPDRFIDFRDFDLIAKRMKVEDSLEKPMTKTWFTSCPCNERKQVKLLDLAMLVTISRLYPTEGIAASDEAEYDPAMAKIFGKRRKKPAANRTTLPLVGGNGAAKRQGPRGSKPRDSRPR
jgi:hypothetical protein